MHQPFNPEEYVLHSDVGCSSCRHRSVCDQIGKRSKVSLSHGMRNGLDCIRIYSAHEPESLIKKKAL